MLLVKLGNAEVGHLPGWIITREVKLREAYEGRLHISRRNARIRRGQRAPQGGGIFIIPTFAD